MGRLRNPVAAVRHLVGRKVAAVGRLFVVGSLNVDSVINVDHHPAPGETVLGGDAQTFFGGKGANQAVAAASAARRIVAHNAKHEAAAEGEADTPRVVFIGRVGEDEAGRTYRARLESLGIDVAPLRLTPGARTGSAIVAVSPSGENTIIVSPGANARLAVDDLSALDDLRPDDVVALTLEVPMTVVVGASERAATAGARLVLNLSPFGDVPLEIVGRADPVIVNEHEAEHAAAHYGMLPSVLITRGARGSDWNGIRVPAQPGLDVIDTTGAGDADCGTLAVSLAAGHDAKRAMRAATVAAARVVERVGAQ